MKIYTKTGDQGTTSLYGGQRLDKDDVRIEAYGTVDELNSHMGWIALIDNGAIDESFIQSLQSELFNMGSHLATLDQSKLPLPKFNDQWVTLMEEAMDQMNESLPPLKSFILPGGSRYAARVHLARTVCRRAERRVVSLGKTANIDPYIVVFLNRLSDYLFVLARYTLLKDGLSDLPWIPSK